MLSIFNHFENPDSAQRLIALLKIRRLQSTMLPKPSTSKLCLIPLLLGLLTACTTSVKERSYEEYYALAPENTFNPVDNDPRVAGMVKILSSFDSEVISNSLDDVYADPLYFNDTFHTFHSRDALKDYFLKLADQSDTQVTFLDVQSSGNDAYVRWSMTIRFSVWWKDIDVNSAGITHIRFDDAGKIIMHHDYWDGVEGFYAHLPVLGTLLKSVRSNLGETGKD